MKTQIIYEDKEILVCHKPAGLAVENAAIGRMDMVSELKNYLKSPYLGVVHRLDQPVEGLLVVAKTQKATAVLSKQLQQNILNKEYFAAVCGQPKEQTGKLVDYLAKDNKTRMAKIVKKGDAEAKEAVLEYEVLGAKELCQTEIAASNSVKENLNISLLKIQIKTGRFHQIRAQLSNAGYPILGDQKYGNEESALATLKTGTKNVALCACSLNFVHPATKEKMYFEIKPNAGVFNLFMQK